MTPIISTTILRTQSDDRLVALARDGHERAFEALVERYRKPLLRHVRRILPEARAEDAVQQAFLNAWSALERGSEVREPRAWLYRVAHNAALNALRVQGYEYDELRESVRSHAAGPAEDHERRWVMRRTLAGLAALPEAQREALLRTAIEGRSQEQVAAELGLSEGAVRGLVYRARTALRAAATALTPAPLVGWAAAFASSDAPMNAAERIAQVAAGGGTASVGAVLAKAGAVVAVTGALATGAVVVRDSANGGRDGASKAEADTIKPGAARRGAAATVPGAALATEPEHGVTTAVERHRGRGRGGGRSGDDHGRGHGKGGGDEAQGRRHAGTGSSGSGETNRGTSKRGSGSGSSGGSGPSGSSGSGDDHHGGSSGSSGSGSSGSGRSGDDGSGHSGSGGSGSSGPGPSGSGSGGGDDAFTQSGDGGGGGGGGTDGGGIDGGGGDGGSGSSGPGSGTPTISTTTTPSDSSGSGSSGSGGDGGHDLTQTDADGGSSSG